MKFELHLTLQNEERLPQKTIQEVLVTGPKINLRVRWVVEFLTWSLKISLILSKKDSFKEIAVFCELT